jgi:hypothetical protein
MILCLNLIANRTWEKLIDFYIFSQLNYHAKYYFILGQIEYPRTPPAVPPIIKVREIIIPIVIEINPKGNKYYLAYFFILLPKLFSLCILRSLNSFDIC